MLNHPTTEPPNYQTLSEANGLKARSEKLSRW